MTPPHHREVGREFPPPLPGHWRSRALEPLWRAAHERLSSGRAVTRLRVGPLDDEQRSAVADLLGTAKLPAEHTTVTLAKLDEVLTAAVGADTRAVVAELLGPFGDRAAERAADSAERQALWEWLDEHETIQAQPALAEWAAQLRRGGIIAGSVTGTRALLDDALRVLAHLPAEGTPLPVLADQLLADSHALDDDTRLSGLVQRGLATIYGTDTPTSAEQRRALWEHAGVADDHLSTVVLSAGLAPTDGSLPATILGACTAAGHAASLTLGQLRSVDALRDVPATVYVVENPSVLAVALRRFGPDCPPLVCTSGWPNSAAILLLRLLSQAGAHLAYHGDFDGEGIRIAAHVITRTGAGPWRMSTDDYLTALRANPAGPDPGRVTDAPWDDALAPAIREHGTAVMEERVTATLLDELGD